MKTTKEKSRTGTVRNDKAVVINRTFDAPRELVFRAWTEPELMKRWWGPKGFTTPVSESDLRVGGRSFSCMRSPEGKDYCGVGVYQEIVRPERLVVTDSFADKDGNVVPASYYGMEGDWPLEMLISVTFTEHDGKTTLSLRHEGTTDIPEAERRNMQQGWEESFDKLDEMLAKER